ncbi:MAG: sensor histidine kinase [Kiritimatiellia bacterium]
MPGSGKDSPSSFEAALKLLVWELRDNPYRKFLAAFLLVSTIPCLALVYLITVVLPSAPETLQKQIPYVLVFLLAITAGGYLLAHRMLKCIIDKLVAYFVRARRADELKSKFVATVSHELKSPLMVLQTNFANLAAGFAGAVTGDQKQILGTCGSVITRMDQLIHDGLDLYKIEAGMVNLNQVSADLRVTLEAQAQELRTLFEKKKVELSLTFESERLDAIADVEKMALVFNNLLSNALKYTPGGGEVSVAAAIDRDFLRFEFVNTGNPIPADRLDIIFDKFEKLDASQEGYGLGLPIAKDIVESHEGRIWAENRGKANAFLVFIPRKGKRDVA